MWLLTVALATAGLKADLLRASAGSPTFSVACSSAREGYAAVRRMASARPSELMDGIYSGAALFDRDGGFTIAAWTKADHGLRFTVASGTPASVADAWAAGSEGTVVATATGWKVEGKNPVDVRQEGDHVVVSNRPPETTTGGVPAALLGRMPDDTGCLAFFQGEVPKSGHTEMVAWFPYAHEAPVTIAVTTPKLAAVEGILLEPGAPAPLHTATPPNLVAVLGVGLDGINFSRFLEGEKLENARKIQRFLPIDAGTVLAAFGDAKPPVIGVRLPLSRNWSPRKSIRRLERLLKKDETAVVTHLDATHIQVATATSPRGPFTVSVAAVPGNLLLSNDPRILSEMEADTGTPWVNERSAHLAESWPLLLVGSTIPSPKGAIHFPSPISLAFDFEGAVVWMALDIPFPLSELKDYLGGLPVGMPGSRGAGGALDAAPAAPGVPGASAPGSTVPAE